MNVLMLQDDWWPQVGGGPIHVRELSIALAENFDCTVDIYTRRLREGGNIYTNQETYANGKVTVTRKGFPTTYHNVLGRLNSLIALVPFRQLKNYDIIHGHTYLPAIPTQIAGLFGDAPTVFTVHGTALNTGVGLSHSRFINTIERYLEGKFILDLEYDHVISVNREHLELLKKSHESVSYIPNGVDIERFCIERNPKPGRILYLGRLAQEKRVDDLIRAMDSITETNSEAELVIVGTGPEKDFLKQLALEYGLSDSVHFTGRVADREIPQYYASAELFVLPSIWEGHPLTLLEAWAVGAPVVATSVEGIAEFVDHKHTGYLVEPKKPEALAEAITYVLEHPNEAEQWGARAQKCIHEEFTWKECAREVYAIYNQLL